MLRSTSPATVRPVSNRLTLVATVVLSTLALAACGGGGGGGSSPPPSAPANPPPPANTAPTVNAGADQTITLPTNAVDLSGSATDAEGNALTYAWTASPATGVSFATASAAASRVTFTTAGTYTLTLTANDGTNNGTDAVQVIVNARPQLTDSVFPVPDNDSDPNHGWAVADPADVGMDGAKLAQAEAYALTGGGAGMIVRRGRVVEQWGDIDKTVDLKSTTKSMGGIALALAIDDSLLTLNDLAQSKLPAFGTAPGANPPFANDATNLDDITIWQLATHTGGFAKDRRATVPLTTTPGTTWSYSDGGLNWLADILSNVYQRDLRLLMTERVWTPLGLRGEDLVWRDLPTTNPATADPRPAIPGNITHRELASGIIANPNAMARVGLLYLRKGMWNNTRIMKEESAALATVPYPAIANLPIAIPADYPGANRNYGLLWWTNATKQLADVPADAYWAWGLGDSLIVVIPSLDIVIARVGTGPDPGPGPYWRSTPVVGSPTNELQPVWNGDYAILKDFLTPIAQSVTTP